MIYYHSAEKRIHQMGTDDLYLFGYLATSVLRRPWIQAQCFYVSDSTSRMHLPKHRRRIGGTRCYLLAYRSPYGPINYRLAPKYLRENPSVHVFHQFYPNDNPSVQSGHLDFECIQSRRNEA